MRVGVLINAFGDMLTVKASGKTGKPLATGYSFLGSQCADYIQCSCMHALDDEVMQQIGKFANDQIQQTCHVLYLLTAPVCKQSCENKLTNHFPDVYKQFWLTFS